MARWCCYRTLDRMEQSGVELDGDTTFLCASIDRLRSGGLFRDYFETCSSETQVRFCALYPKDEDLAAYVCYHTAVADCCVSIEEFFDAELAQASAREDDYDEMYPPLQKPKLKRDKRYNSYFCVF